MKVLAVLTGISFCILIPLYSRSVTMENYLLSKYTIENIANDSFKMFIPLTFMGLISYAMFYFL